MSRINLKVKRIYEAPARSDGRRVLVDRLWPRGVSKEDAKLDEWNKDVAPSDALRKWFGHDPSKWGSFKSKYFDELEKQDNVLGQLLGTCSSGRVTLLFAAKDEEHNNAVALTEYLDTQIEPKG